MPLTEKAFDLAEYKIILQKKSISMVKLNLIISISFLSLLLNAQTSDTIIDKRDGNKYKVIQIGDQWWTAQNANFKTSSGSWYYNNDSIKYAKKYGRLYDWEAAMQCCPEGWHLPSDEEWKQLEMEIGLTREQVDSYNLRGTVEGGKLKLVGFDFWNTPNEGATDELGFSALGAGVGGEGNFFVIGEGTSFWTSSDNGSNDTAWFRSLHYDRADIHRGFYLKQFTYSVRCVKDHKTLTQTIEWTLGGEMPMAKKNLVAVSQNHSIFIIGGIEYRQGKYTKTIYQFLPETEKWEQIAIRPRDANNVVIALNNDSLFIISGDCFLDNNDMYSISKDIWHSMSKMPTARQHTSYTILDKKIYVFGLTAWDKLTDKNEVYDITNNIWIEKAPLPTPRHIATAVVIGGEIYVIGGAGDINSVWTSRSTVDVYCPETNTWEKKKDMPQQRSGHCAVALSDKIYVIGGWNSNNEISNEILVYDVLTNSWTVDSNLPSTYLGHCSATVYNGCIYVFGGCNKDYEPTSKIYIGQIR